MDFSRLYSPVVNIRTTNAAPQSLCRTCRFWEIRRYLMRGRWQESTGCHKHIMHFPDATECRDYEREPGSDDE